MRKHFISKMKTLLTLAFEVNCHAKEPCKIMSKTMRNIVKFKSFVEHIML